MKTKGSTILQLLLRLALSASFLSAVADRFGFWAANHSSWGNWNNFLAYSQSVNSFAGPQLNDLLAIVATFLEVLLAFLLLTGYKIKLAATASAALLLSFALAMTYSFGIKPSLDYSVWTASAATYALSLLNHYPYSIDNLIAKMREGKKK